MEELSWRARLARKNINILSTTDTRWFYEFMYHPYQGQTKWCKTFYDLDPMNGETTHSDFSDNWYVDSEKAAAGLEKEVLALRKELER